MNKPLFAFIALFFFLCGCRPEKETVNNNYTPPYDKIVVNGFLLKDSATVYPDVVLNYADSETHELVIYAVPTRNGQRDEQVTVTISGLPAGVTATPATSTFPATGQYVGAMQVSCDTGVYPFQVTVTSPSLGANTFNVKLHVVYSTACASCLVRYWRCVDNCGRDSCTPVFAYIPGKPHWVSIRNISCLGDSVVVNAMMMCDGANSSITIPLQTSNGYTIYGQTHDIACGTIATFSIPDTIIHNGDTQRCSFWIRSW